MYPGVSHPAAREIMLSLVVLWHSLHFFHPQWPKWAKNGLEPKHLSWNATAQLYHFCTVDSPHAITVQDLWDCYLFRAFILITELLCGCRTRGTPAWNGVEVQCQGGRTAMSTELAVWSTKELWSPAVRIFWSGPCRWWDTTAVAKLYLR